MPSQTEGPGLSSPPVADRQIMHDAIYENATQKNVPIEVGRDLF